MAKRWNYNGDMNLTYGGYFWQESGYADHVYCVEVIPYSDMGGADNLFIIELGSIYLPVDDAAMIRRALECIGTTPEAATRADMVYAFKAYTGQDVRENVTVQIGKELDPYTTNHREPTVDVVLRGNVKLKNYVRREFLD